MVGKLMKHELYALFRVLVFFMIAAVAFGVLGRVFVAVEVGRGDGPLSILFIVFHIFALCALVIAAYALGVSRFYKTLFTGEGYLTLSLPATPAQILWAKLLSSIVAVLAAGAVSALTVSLYLIGWNKEVMESIGELFGEFWSLNAELLLADPLYAVEAIVGGVLSLPVWLLLVYTGLCIGQLFSSKRKLWMFLVFAGGYVIIDVFLQLCFTPILLAADGVSGHLSGWIVIALTAAVDVGCFFFVRFILKNKVNLIP